MSLIIQRRKLVLLIFILVVSLVKKAWSQTPAIPEVLDAELTGYTYPCPVHFLNLKIENQACRMAYMDAVPEKFNASRPAIVLLHGKNFLGAYWRQTIKFLNKQGYRVIVPDQIGFGKSSKPSLHYSFHQLATNTRQLLDTLGVTKAIVIGHSMGGMLATRFALMYPEVVTKLILENPIGLEDYRPIVPFTTLDAAYQKEVKTSEESIRNYFKTYFPEWKPEYDEWVKIPAAQTHSKDYPEVAFASAQTYDMIYQQPIIYELEQLQMPTLLIIGQTDRTVVGKANIKDKTVLAKAGNYPTLGRKAVNQIRTSKLVGLPGIGHIPHLQDPDAFHKAVTNFLR
ncbi:alpha/beta fold hydrolase [Adhaeribacter radiodurans]|uniref:Alpha/beta hydrolase n=1 Tax=Adhaeribacter radiodurans TaxID=2745197 RepID=A0A7L7L7L6_9BACT|nr:alpha/beta hydrolase [Adhaeribacter radiodurans]QMU28816.1 alpha/beta hydrolase [Adhaeribacter radiodurans]